MQLNNKNTKEYLNAFAKYVIQQSRSNLSKGGKNSTKDLYNSLDKEIEVGANSFRLAFLMEDYGKFIDKGVQGSNPSGIKNGFNKAPNSPYKFKSKMIPTRVLDKWVIKKGIAPRSKSGKFLSREGIKFALAKSIALQGIKPSLFFTKPFEKAFERLPDELVEAYGLDVEQFLEYTINKK
jgi:hypothetical protein